MGTEFIEGDHCEIASATRSELEALGAAVGSVHARPVGDLAEHLRGPRTAVGYLGPSVSCYFTATSPRGTSCGRIAQCSSTGSTPGWGIRLTKWPTSSAPLREPVILLGSALWWLERWSARAGVDDLGGVDPSGPKPQSYYLKRAVRRLERFETAVGRVPAEGGAA